MPDINQEVLVPRNLRKRLLAIVLILLPGSAFAASPAIVAQESATPWQRFEFGSLRLVSDCTVVGSDSTAVLAVEMRLVRGWKTYWRVPGDSGVPTRFDFSGSRNLADTKVKWPAPTRYNDYDFETLGYDGRVLIPVEVQHEPGSKELQVKLKLDYGVCKDMCIPKTTEFELTLPVRDGPSATSDLATAIHYALSTVPAGPEASKLHIRKAEVQNDGFRREVVLYVDSDVDLDWPDAVIESTEGFRFGVPAVDVSYDRRSATMKMPIWSESGDALLADRDVTVVIWDKQAGGLEQNITITAKQAFDLESGY